MVKVPKDKYYTKYGREYYIFYRHIRNIKQKYNIDINIKKLNNLYGIKQYNK